MRPCMCLAQSGLFGPVWRIPRTAHTLTWGPALSSSLFINRQNSAEPAYALSRLVRRGSLIRVGRGHYVRPVEGRFGVRPPQPATVVQAIAEQRGENVVPHGAANELGLTTQVPVREVYLTSGPTRKLKLGNQVVELLHAPVWQLALPGRTAGALIRALAGMVPERSVGLRCCSVRPPAALVGQRRVAGLDARCLVPVTIRRAPRIQRRLIAVKGISD